MSLYTSIARPPSKRSTGVGQDFSFLLMPGIPKTPEMKETSES